MGVNDLSNTINEGGKESNMGIRQSIEVEFNTRIMCSLCNKHPIIINKEEKKFDISEQDLKNSFFINYNDWGADHSIEGIKYKGLFYIISEINEKNKFSKEYANCTAIVAIGRSKKTGKNISFLSHQHPDSVEGNMFKIDFTKSLNELKEKSLEGSIDIVILGGNNNYIFNEYNKTITTLGYFIEDILKIDVDITGGYTNNGIESKNDINDALKDIYLDTKTRRIYFYKHFLDQKSNIDFKSSDIGNIF